MFLTIMRRCETGPGYTYTEVGKFRMEFCNQFSLAQGDPARQLGGLAAHHPYWFNNCAVHSLKWSPEGITIFLSDTLDAEFLSHFKQGNLNQVEARPIEEQEANEKWADNLSAEDQALIDHKMKRWSPI